MGSCNAPYKGTNDITSPRQSSEWRMIRYKLVIVDENSNMIISHPVTLTQPLSKDVNLLLAQ